MARRRRQPRTRGRQPRTRRRRAKSRIEMKHGKGKRGGFIGMALGGLASILLPSLLGGG